MSAPHTETVTIEKMAAGGDAIGRHPDGRVVFVEGALPGETVRVSVITSKKDFAKGVVNEVLEPAVDRVVPPCPEIERGCGGCGWQHVSPEAQMGLKVGIVVDALRRTAKLSDAVVKPGGSVSPWGYRTTARLSVAPDGCVGFRAAASHRTVAVGGCMVAHPSLAALLPGLRVRGAEELTLRVSVATGEVTAMADSDGAHIEGLPEGAGTGPSAVLHEVVGGARLRVSAGSFFQSGPQAADLLVKVVGEASGVRPESSGGPMLDAYGGVGLFAATLGASQSIVVESSALACADAEVNLGERAKVECIPFERWSPRPVDLAVADPARAGLGREGVAVIAATGASRLVLVSCDPAAMARDTSLLMAHGYRHAGSTVLDLFPQTHHVEVVTRFDLT